jgi:hypothetical protein
VFATVFALLMADLIATGNRQAAEQRRIDAAAMRDRLERLREDQRPRRARLAPGAAVVPALERAITADVRGRVEDGVIDGPVRSTSCTVIGNTGRTAYNCFTLSRRFGSTPKLENGYRFAAKADAGAGTLVWCKTNPRPLHPDTSNYPTVPLPRVCLP